MKTRQDNDVTNRISAVYVKKKKKPRYHVWSNQVRSVIKTRQDHDVIVCIGLVYAEVKTELLGPNEHVQSIKKTT